MASRCVMTFNNKERKNISTEAKLRNCFLVQLSGKVALSRSLLLIALLCVHYERAESVSVERPRNAIVIVNQSTLFNCSKSSHKSIEPIWYHHPLVGVRQDVYDDQRIRDKYKDRFSIDKNITSGAFNLLVQRPVPTDAGRYECVEDVEEYILLSAELTVLHSNLVCESNKDLNEVIGPTECANPIAPDQLQLSCRVTYSGNFAPQMQWRKADSELESNETKCGVLGNRVMCNATLEAKRNMDGFVYICQVSTAEQYNCSLKVNKTIYTFSDNSVRAITTSEEAFCSANTSKDLPCSYKWFKDNKTDQFGQTLKPSNPGLYRCEAVCKIRNETCAFTATVISVSESASSITESGNYTLLWVLVLLIIAIVSVAGLVYYLWKRSLRPQPIIGSPPGPLPVPSPGLRPAPQSGRLLEEIPLITDKNKGNETDEENAIKKACEDARFIGRGLNGNIRGPGQYKGKQCAYEEIVFTDDQQTIRNKEGVTDVQKICRNGNRWRRLTHENLIKIHEVILKSEAVYIIMEYAAGRSLRKQLKKRAEDLPMPVVKDWATQIAQGLKFLHEKGIVHKNIKSSQIFILEEIKEQSDISGKNLKIGCINFLDSDSETHATSLLQEPSYLSPETYKTGAYSKESDVWSFSVVIWEILTRKRPDELVKESEKISKDLENLNLFPEKLKGILNDCRLEEPSERPTFVRILERLQEWQL